MIATLGIVLVVGLLVLASAVTGVIDRSISANQLRSHSAYYLAQSGIDTYKTGLFRNLVDYYSRSGAGWCESPIQGGIIDPTTGVTLLGVTTDRSAPVWAEGSLGQGTYRVMLELSDTFLVLTSEGFVADSKSTVQLVASAGGGPASAWDNAILARGSTPTAKAINGNVTVYGSIHIVEGNIDGTLAVGGNAGIYNGYEGDGGGSNNIVSQISNIVDTNVNLCARVKIHTGSIYLESGSVDLGSPLNPLYSIHLRDGIVCREREGDGSCRTRNIIGDHLDSDLVYLRYPEGSGINSPYGQFDLTLPVLTPAFFDRAYATSVNGVRAVGCEWLYQGSTARLPPADPNATSSVCGTSPNTVQWVAGSPARLVVSGTVNIPDADLEVVGEVLYDGKGTLLVGEGVGDSSAHITFTNGGSIRPRTNLSYPRQSALGLMSSGDMTFGSTAANEPSAALLYAQGVFTAQKQVTLVGAVVADSFNLGNQVPKIAYHPDVRFAAEDLCLPGTACAGDGVPQNAGVLSDIAIERR